MKWDNAKIHFLTKNYHKLGCKECAILLNLPLSTVKSKIGHLGLTIDKETKNRIQSYIAKSYWSKNLRKRNVDAQKFIDCKTPEHAYVLGILWADGYLNNISQHCLVNIELTKKDCDEIIPIFLSTGKWHISERKATKERKARGRIATAQRPLYNFLKTNDYEIKSTASPTKILRIIPQKLKQFWWRGYFDGDGCFYFNKKNHCRQITFAGSYEQDWLMVEELLKNLNIKFKVIKRIQGKNKHSSVRITSIENIKKFGNYIYKKLPNIGLKRKRIKFQEMIGM